MSEEEQRQWEEELRKQRNIWRSERVNDSIFINCNVCGHVLREEELGFGVCWLCANEPHLENAEKIRKVKG